MSLKKQNSDGGCILATQEYLDTRLQAQSKTTSFQKHTSLTV